METEKMYLTILNNLSDGVYFVNNDRRILFWNKAAEMITGYTSEEIVGKCCQDTLLNHIDEGGKPLCICGCPLFSTLTDGEARKARVFVRHKAGYRIPVFVQIVPVKEEGEIIGAIETFSRDSKTVYDDNLIEHLSGIAMHDALTRLPNRHYIEHFLEYKYKEYKKFGRLFAVAFADIDNFGHFNNAYGHAVGDMVLSSIGDTMLKRHRSTDLIGRWGGEEFIGIYSIKEASEAESIGENFRRIFSDTKIEHDGEVLTVTASVGVSVVLPSDTPETLWKRADALMYKGKEAGKNRVIIG